ncbi:unnamed protein product [Durusdinium trenchii]|uniref:Uncharacterized protein n=2 Tax=Durusdinium trenchii TaxID=1381693 RepID=A0ABP0PMD3_9DINO
MSVASSLFSSISGYIPTSVKDAAGLNPQISEAVRHITWLSIERVLWPEEEHRQLLVIGYTDGFQVWDLQDPTSAKELVSKQDKPVLQARLLPFPLLPVDASADVMGVTAAPLMAYLHKGAPALVRLFSLKSHEDVHLLRLTEPAKHLQASRRFLAVGFAKQVELFDALHFQVLFSVQCHGALGPTFALGHRWLAYNLPPHETVSSSSGAVAHAPGVRRQLPTALKDGLQYLGQVGQRTLDQVFMPPSTDTLSTSSPGSLRSGSIAVRDVASQNVISQFEDHSEPIEAMIWDPSGLQLVTCGALGHRILVHRAMLGTGDTLLEQGGLAGTLGFLRFEHLFTLSRGLTPAVISGLCVSDDAQLVAVSSAKGTTHVFHLPPFHAQRYDRLLEPGAVARHGAGSRSPVGLNVCTRVRNGSVLLQEGLLPQCTFFNPPSRSSSSFPWMYVATRAGSLAVYSLNANSGPSSEPETSGDEWAASLLRETRICRPLRHFCERRLAERGPLVPRSERAPEEAEPSTWLAEAETATQLPLEVPLWMSPQLRFYAYPSDLPPERLNAQLRRGLAPPPSRRAVEITAVQGVPPTEWRNDECGEWLGALGAAVGSEVAAPREGVLRGQRGVREEEEEEWVKA